MKKLIALLLALVMVLSLAACGKDNDEQTGGETESADAQIQENGSEEKEPVASGEITMAALMAAPESPAEDFSITEYEEGKAILLGYLGDDEIVVIPESLNITHIEKYTFANNTDVKAIRLSNSVEVIGFGAFGGCEALQLVACGDAIRELGESAFQNCYNLREITLKDGLTKIEAYALSGSDCLMSVEIPASVTEIHYAAFYAAAEGFTIIGEAGSYAEQYATEEGIPFQAK